MTTTDKLATEWADRIDGLAKSAVSQFSEAMADDREGLQIEASEAVSIYLLNCPAWGEVEAKDISDIAYGAVGHAMNMVKLDRLAAEEDTSPGINLYPDLIDPR